MGSKQLAKKLLLLLLVNIRNRRAGDEAVMYQVWASHKPNIGHSLTLR